MVLQPLRSALPAEEADRRVQLVASQMIGLVMTRYLLALEPLASMPVEDVVAWVAPHPAALPRRPAALTGNLPWLS